MRPCPQNCKFTNSEGISKNIFEVYIGMGNETLSQNFKTQTFLIQKIKMA